MAKLFQINLTISAVNKFILSPKDSVEETIFLTIITTNELSI